MKARRETIIRDVYEDVEFDGEKFTIYEYFDDALRSMLFEVRDANGSLVLDEDITAPLEDLVTRFSMPSYT